MAGGSRQERRAAARQRSKTCCRRERCVCSLVTEHLTGFMSDCRSGHIGVVGFLPPANHIKNSQCADAPAVLQTYPVLTRAEVEELALSDRVTDVARGSLEEPEEAGDTEGMPLSRFVLLGDAEHGVLPPYDPVAAEVRRQAARPLELAGEEEAEAAGEAGDEEEREQEGGAGEEGGGAGPAAGTAAASGSTAALLSRPHRVCDHCGMSRRDAEAAGRSLKRCARCLNVRYCSLQCQRAAWDAGHFQECQDLAREREQRLASEAGLSAEA